MSAAVVSIVGAGPWDPELITLAARDRLARADVVIVDVLVNPAVLRHCHEHAQILRAQTGGPATSRARVDALLVEHAEAGRRVVWLEGGDSTLFGGGAEQAQRLAERGIPFEFVPGVSSPIAALAAAGIPVTHGARAASVCFASGEDACLADAAGTLVVMDVEDPRACTERLIAAGRSANTPAALVRWGPRGTRATLVGSLGDIAEGVDAAVAGAPALIVIGEVVALHEQLRSRERRPLLGRRVVVTRAQRQSGGLVDLLAAEGADALAVPCLDFVAADADAQLALDQALGAIAAQGPRAFAGVILSSPNGAEALAAALDRGRLDARIFAGLEVVAIGPATAARLGERGLRPDIVAKHARAEGLIAALRERELLGARWLQVRADEGRELLDEAIAEAGGELELIVGYRTIRPAVSAICLASLRPVARGGAGYDAICFASGRTARHFIETVSEAFGDTEAREQLARAKVIAIGPVTADAIAALGVRVDGVAERPGDAGLLAAVRAALGAR